MGARERPEHLKPHTNFIVEQLARFKTHDEICGLLAGRGAEATPDDIRAFAQGRYKKVVERKRQEITANLSIVKSEFVLMMLDEMVHNHEASIADKMAALRLRTSMLKKSDTEPSAEELLRDADEEVAVE